MPDRSTPLVTIIMPTYNRARLIAESIGSVRSQTYSNWELVIIDDGSEDDTEEVVKSIGDDRVSFCKAGRIGIGGKIKNIGLEKANGQLIAFIDSDDLWARTKLEKQVAALAEFPEAGFCLTGGYNFRAAGSPTEFFYKQSEGHRYDNLFADIFRSKVAVFAQALLFRKRCLSITGNFLEARAFSDTDFIATLAWHYKGVVLYEPLLCRRLHDANYITPNWERSYYDGMEMIRDFLDKKMLASKEARDALFRLYINFGEKCLIYKQRLKAIKCFAKSWLQKPFSIVPAKKIAKAILKF
jgi:glycosyltransferase involved in cell wall biosynthesis